MRNVSLCAVAVFLVGCPTRARVHGDDGGGGDGGGPSISIVSPASMTYASRDVAIEVQVAGGTATTVDLRRNDMPWQQLSGPPFRYTWDTRPAPEGDYALAASATIDGRAVTSDPITITVDHTPPQVTDVSPARGSSSGDLGAPIKVTFSEPVLASTVNDASVQLSAGGSLVASTVALASDAKSLTVSLTDAQALALPANLAASVATTITDRAGNALAALDPPWTWTVPAWITLPPLASELPPRLAIDGARRPVVAYATLDNIGGDAVQQVHVARFEGSAWNTALGAPSAAKGTAYYGYSIALDSAGNPVVAWTEYGAGHQDVHVGAWKGSSWDTTFPALVGINDVSRDATFPSVRIDGADRPVVAWKQVTGTAGPTYDVFAARWNGTSWARLDGSGFMGGAGFDQLLDGPQLVLDTQGNPLLGWADRNLGTGVSFWTNTWTKSAALPGGFTPYPVVDAIGAPLIAIKDVNLRVVKWNTSSSSWADATATPLTMAGAWTAPRLVLSPDGAPVVAWLDTSSGVRIGVARWTGAAWDTRFGLFNAGQSPANNVVPELVVDARGRIWVAWREGTAIQVWMSNY